MNSFLQKFSGNIKGVITGFDRIVFKGCLRPLMFPEGAMSFLRSRGVLNKNYKSWVMTQSKALADSADAYARSRQRYFLASHHQRQKIPRLGYPRQRPRTSPGTRRSATCHRGHYQQGAPPAISRLALGKGRNRQTTLRQGLPPYQAPP